MKAILPPFVLRTHLKGLKHGQKYPYDLVWSIQSPLFLLISLFWDTIIQNLTSYKIKIYQKKMIKQ